MQSQINSLLQDRAWHVYGSIASTANPPVDPPTSSPAGLPLDPPASSKPAAPTTGTPNDPGADGWPAPAPAAADCPGIGRDREPMPIAPVDRAPPQRSTPAGAESVKATDPRVKVTLSGQINRAINVVDDGKDTDAFFVDNDASNSRFRLVAEGKFSQVGAGRQL